MKLMKKMICLGLAVSLVAASMSGCAKSKSDTFYIGGSGPLTGSAAVYGQSVQNGAQLAVDEINKAGGINGTKIEFSYEDDEADGEKAVNAYNTLKDKGMKIMMGTVTSGACSSVIEKTNDDGMYQLTPSASSEDVLALGNVYQVCIPDPMQGVVAAQYIADKKMATKVAVIYDSSDNYSSGIEAAFKEEAANQDFEIVSEEVFTADSKSDFSVQVQKAKDNGAELVFLPIYYSEAALIMQQAAALDYSPIFLGCDGLDGILSVEGFDTSLAEGTILITPFTADAPDEATQAFTASYKEAYGDAPNQFAADAYDAIYIIKAAIEKSGATSDMSIKDLGDALKGAMPELTIDGLTGLGMTWAEDGKVNKGPKIFSIQNGSYVLSE